MQERTMKMKLERLISNKLVDKEFVAISNTVSDERDKVTMVDATDDLNLRLEFSLALPAPALEALHSDNPPIRQNTLVNEAVTALPQHIDLREAIGGVGKLLIAELVHTSHVLRLDRTMLP